MSIIEVKHVTKEYRLGTVVSLKDSAVNLMRRLRRQPLQERPVFKALDDINFAVEQGEVVGIIGHNGAGKSTLLKILSRVSIPTGGSVAVRGKVAPLIEVGAGLNPEMTGRENIFLNASILGVPREEIRRKMDDIIAFAELEEFIDTPVKRYSSGMRVKLGFSIATSIDAEILIVDEVLAVGDLAFQRKCFDRMEGLIKGRGNTVLLVSHNIRQVERMCSRVIMLDHGRVVAEGAPLEVTDLFYRQSNERIDAYHKGAQGAYRSISSSGEVELALVEILDQHERPTESVPSGGMLRVRVRFVLNRPLERPEIVVGTHTTDFFYLSASSTAALDERPDLAVGTHEVEYIVPMFPLVAGSYCIRFAVFDRNRRTLFAGENLKTFSVSPSAREIREPPMRRLSLPAEWRLDGLRFGAASNRLSEATYR
ncbi:MAG: ABC transporter ATP-binding protein [Nitrospiraceae bacterium]|nr:MAG: ABC transporter ATP-binding protein [Nitrospiraceae bacterium]